MSKNTKSILTFVVALFACAAILGTIPTGGTGDTVSFDKIAAGVRAGEVKKLTVSEGTVVATFKDDTKKNASKEPNDSLPTLLQTYGVQPEQLAAVEYSYAEPSAWGNALVDMIPLLAIGLLSIVGIWYVMRQAQGANSKSMNFGNSTAKEFDHKKDKRVTFDDVAGNKEAKVELEEVVEFLRDPKRFLDLGARIPRGVLLIGAPGTGKTMMARAVAGEAKVPFFHISGSEFVEMFVGVGASRARDLFRKAKKQAPAIIFIDEIDAVGRQRGSGLGGSHDEREQTLNQILVEMDGFEKDTNVIVMGATNRPDVLDPALLRPGRFDRRVTLDLPDINDREAILKAHAIGKPLAENVNLRVIAERTPGFSGADLANMMNEAAILAGRRKEKSVTMQMCVDSIEKVMMGPERRSHILTTEEKKVTAYHEAGHAIVAHFQPGTDPVHKISIVSRGSAGGYTMKLPSEDRHLHRLSDFTSELAILLAGHTAEKETFGQVTTGASNDLSRATKLARALVTQYGMSENLGPRTYGEHEEMIFLGRQIHENRDYSEAVAEKIDKEITALIAAAQDKARDIITKHKNVLDKIAATLVEKETIEQAEFRELVG